MNRVRFLLSTSLLGFAVVAQPAFAQDAPKPASKQASSEAKADAANAAADKPETDSNGVPIIVVTAERRAADLQSTAAAVTVRTGEDLATQGKFTTRQVLEDIPGVVAVNNNSFNTGSSDVQGNNITIRGITPGETAGPGFSQISPTPATAVYVDGVYEGVGGTYDLSRVEVLRGPQGTLYGRSATAGVVAFHTRNPMLDQFEADGSVEFGSYDLQHYSGAVNIPVGSTLALRVSGDYYDQGNGFFGEARLGKRERLNGRAKLLWEPTPDLSVLLGYAYEKDNAFTGGNEIYANPARVTTTTTSPFYPGHKEQNQYWAEVNWDLGPVVITYQPAYRTWVQNDHVLQQGNFLGSGVPIEQLVKTPKNSFHTQELRIASDGTSALTWLVGAYYYDNHLDTSLRNYLADANDVEIVVQSLTSDQKNTRDIGAFAEATYAVTPSLRLTLGARYDDTRIIFNETAYENPYSLCGTILQGVLPPFIAATCTGPGQSFLPPGPSLTVSDLPIKAHNFNYRARVEYDVSPSNMLYASVSTGFRPGDGGISRQVAPPPAGPSLVLNIYGAEKLTAFEIGSKNRFLDNRLQLNAAAYYYDYSGYHTTFLPDTPAFDPASPAGMIRTTVPARVKGAELELLYRPSSHDQLMLNYSYVNFHWHNKPAAFAAAQTEAGRASIPHTVVGAYQHSFDLPGETHLVARIDGKFEAAHRTQDLHIDWLRIGYGQYVHVGDRMIGNAQLTFLTKDGRYTLTGYVRNFTNAKEPTLVVQGDPTAMRVDYADPRVFGVRASAAF